MKKYIHESGLPTRVRAPSANPKIGLTESKQVPGAKPRYMPKPPYVVGTLVATVKTCPDTCLFKDGACSAEASQDAADINACADGWEPLDILRKEVELVRAIPRDLISKGGADGGWNIRYHIMGDVYDSEGHRVLADGHEDYLTNGGGAGWTYTHLWPELDVKDSGSLVVIASVETARQMEQALDGGWPIAIVVPQWKNGSKPFSEPGYRLPIYPCPAEFNVTTCVECGRCWNEEFLAKYAIGFTPHGKILQITRARLDLVRLGLTPKKPVKK